MRSKFVLVSHAVWLCGLSTANLVSAQNSGGAPAGNPLDTLPQLTKPLNDTWKSSGDSNAILTLSRNLQPQHPLMREVQTNSIEISGVNALPFETIAAHFTPLTGQRTTIAVLANAVAMATQTYQKAGYPLSFVYLPEQSFEGGVVRVIAVEGHINGVNVTGDRGKSEKLLEDMVQPIMEERPLTTQTFQRQTMLLSRLDNLKVVSTAAAPTTTDGGTPLQLIVDRNPILFNVGADLRQGDPKAVATLTLNDPLWGGSQWQLTALLDNWNEERFVSATLNETLNASGTRLSLNASEFKGKDNFLGNTLQDITSQRRVSVGVTHPWKLSQTSSTIIGATLFGLDYQKTYDFPTLNVTLTDREKVRAIQAHWNWQKIGTQSQQSANASLTQGFDAWGAAMERSTLLGTNEAKLDFTRLSLDYAVRWRAKNMWGVAFGAGGQTSPHILPTSERISFGGTRFGRGYRNGEAAGDQGVGISLEANRLFVRQNGKWLKTVEPFVLYEHAQTWFHQTSWQGQKLQSTSLGLRLSDSKHYALDVAVSKPHGDKSPINPQQHLRYSLILNYNFDM